MGEDGVDVKHLGEHPKQPPLLEGLQQQELQQQSPALAICILAAAAAFVAQEEDPEEGEDEEAHGGMRRDGLDRMEQLGDAAGEWHGQDQGQGRLARAECWGWKSHE